MDIERIKQQVFVCCPFDLLVNKHLPCLLKGRINPEIGLNGEILDQFQRSKFKKVARILKKEGLICTVHAPYSDLSLGAIDPKVRRITVERIRRALDLASLFEAKSVVCHTGFDYKHYFNSVDIWMKNAVESLITLLECASKLNIPVMLENVYELDSEIHKDIFRKVKSPLLGFCLDVGHQNVFSKTSLDKWLKALGDRLGQIHLHDNMGVHDDHLAIGEGVLDFDSLFSWLYGHGKTPILTLEPHEESALMPTLKGLARLLNTYPIISDYA
nr:sugar phosphate isomerase/epimerase [Deltaproteobacteria bacterium]